MAAIAVRRTARRGASEWPVAGWGWVRLAELTFFSVCGLAFALAVAVRAGGGSGFDAYAYWAGASHPYAAPVGGLGAFTYSPPAAAVFGLARLLSWPHFHVLWLGVELACLAWLLRRWTLVGLLVVPVIAELYAGNIHLLLSVAIVAGFRYPAAWSVVLLTKVTPGVGLLWFAVRREWRSLGIALGVTAVIAGVSLAATPEGWRAWVSYLAASAQGDAHTLLAPLWFRLTCSALLVTWGALTDRPWTVVAAATLACPVVWWSSAAMLAGCVASRRWHPCRVADASVSTTAVARASERSQSGRPRQVGTVGRPSFAR